MFLVRNADDLVERCLKKTRRSFTGRFTRRKDGRASQPRRRADSRGAFMSLIEADTVNPEETSRTRQH